MHYAGIPWVSVHSIQSNPVQWLSRVWLFATPCTAAHQASLSITNSQSLFRLTSIESVMPPNHLILLSPSPSTFNLSQHQGLYKWVNSSHQVAKVLELQLQHQSFQWIFNKLVIPKHWSAEEVLSEKTAMGNAAWVPTLGFPAHISKLQSGKPDLKRQLHLAHPFWNKIPFR